MEEVYDAANFSTVNTVPSVVTLDRLRDSFLRMRIRVNQHVLNTDDKKFAEIDKQVDDMRKLVDEASKNTTLLSDDKDKAIQPRARGLGQGAAADRGSAAGVARQSQRQGACLAGTGAPAIQTCRPPSTNTSTTTSSWASKAPNSAVAAKKRPCAAPSSLP
jgi:methyl-accepting chemotaxis protein